MQMDLRTMAEHMGAVAWGVVIVLFIMSMYSIAVMIERYYTYNQATKQSRRYAPEVARFLKQGKIKEAIDVSHGKEVKHSHLAKVLVVGLQEWQYQQEIGETERDKEAAVDAAKRAIQRATAVNLADLKRGLSGLATIGSTAPFVGLFGTTFGIINAFTGMAQTGSGGIAAISGGIAEALITTAFGLFVAVPAVWMYNYFLNKVERFNVEMSNSGSEMAIYFMKEVGVGDEKAVG
jgi:biopolymer transport protein ExbB/biopolymer transport protein TolQ